MQRRMRWMGQLACSTVAAALVVVGLEGLSRIAGEAESAVVTPTSRNCLRRNPELGMELAPHCAATWQSRALSGDRPTAFTTNALGFRDAEIEEDGATRILALGDSCTWGWQVAQDDAYPQRLQRLLRERVVQPRYRVVNAGIPGYTSYQGLRILPAALATLRPAIVIIGYGFNDAAAAPDLAAALARQRTLLPLLRLDDVLIEHSSLWRRLRRAVVDRSAVPQSAINLLGGVARAQTAPEIERRVPLAMFATYVARMVELCRAAGARPVLLSFLGSPSGEDPYAQAMGRIAAAAGIPLVVYDGPRIDVVHPTAAGYADLATTIVDTLQASGDVPAPQPGEPRRDDAGAPHDSGEPRG